MVLRQLLRSTAKAAAERRRLVAAILSSFYGRTPGPEEIDAHVGAHGAKGDLADCATSLLGVLNASSAPHFVPPGHYYSPITPTDEVDRHLARMESRPIPETLAGLTIDRDVMMRLWTELLPYLSEIPFEAEAKPPLRYRLDNPAYAWGDGSILHALLRLHKPRRVIEIGSGWSTLCTLDTIERHLDGPCHVTLVEPYPDLVKSLLGQGRAPDVVLEKRVQDVPLDIFDALERDDVLFIDSTHVARTGSDVCHELFEILPRLKSGVLVHFHDIFWPFEYPRDWAVNENRSWNEAYLLRAYLTNSADWSIVWFNDYMARYGRERIEADYPAFLRNPGGAIWLRKA